MENLRNQDSIGAKEILIVSFGTSFPETRKKTIGAIEDAAEAAYPEFAVRRCFTSRMILAKLAKRDGLSIDSIEEALERAEKNGVQELIVQPTHLMDGNEYHKLLSVLDQYKNAFAFTGIGSPLLSSEEDFMAAADAVETHFPKDASGKKAAALMGHGTDAASNAVYAKLQEVLRRRGRNDIFIATVEGAPVIEDILPEILDAGYESVILAPFMIVAGDHANNDLAGNEEDSWKSIFEKNSLKTEARLQGIGEWPEVQELFVKHIAEVLNKI